MSLHKDYFDDVYTGNADPFRLSDNWYEERKYSLTLAALPRAHYRRALEPGCSIGILTEKLGGRCASLISTDVVGAALDAARERVTATELASRVTFVEWSLTDEWDVVAAGESFDLIVLSEVGYYLDEADLRQAATEAVAHLEAGGTLLAVHWRHPVADYPLSGDDVHAVIGGTDGLIRVGGYVDEDVILEVYVAASETPESVARIEGLV